MPVVQVDTSSKNLRAALIQKGKPKALTSNSITETEQHYANIGQELLAVVFRCKKFRTYIYGFLFIIESDHKPLKMISKRNLTAAPDGLQRKLLHLQEYDMVIMYRAEKDITLSDVISRLPNKRVRGAMDLYI